MCSFIVLILKEIFQAVWALIIAENSQKDGHHESDRWISNFLPNGKTLGLSLALQIASIPNISQYLSFIYLPAILLEFVSIILLLRIL